MTKQERKVEYQFSDSFGTYHTVKEIDSDSGEQRAFMRAKVELDRDGFKTDRLRLWRIFDV